MQQPTTPPVVTEDQAKRIDAEMLAFKQRDGYALRLEASAMRLQLAENARKGYAA